MNASSFTKGINVAVVVFLSRRRPRKGWILRFLEAGIPAGATIPKVPKSRRGMPSSNWCLSSGYDGVLPFKGVRPPLRFDISPLALVSDLELTEVRISLLKRPWTLVPNLFMRD